MPLAVLGATGVAVAVTGAAQHVAWALPRLVWPLVTTGQVALSVHVGHMLRLAADGDALDREDPVAAFGMVAALTVAAAVLCARGEPPSPAGRWRPRCAASPPRRGAPE